MRKILAMGASVAMLLATTAPVFAITPIGNSATIIGNDVTVKANSGLNEQEATAWATGVGGKKGTYVTGGGISQLMTTGDVLAIGMQGITSNVGQSFGKGCTTCQTSTSFIMGNDVKVKANSGLNEQEATAWATGTSSKCGLTSVTGGGVLQAMGTGMTQAQGTQWITSNVNVMTFPKLDGPK